MNYIYDIILNFQNNYYDFFEWRREDKIKNITKIPIYKINDKDLLNLKYNKVIIDNKFIEKIKEDNKKNKNLICLVSNQKTTLGLLFDEKGNLLKRSSLIFEEEEEANDYVKKLQNTPIKYLKNIKTNIPNKLRVEIEKKDTLINYLTSTNDTLTLKYLYFEYFDKECNDIKTIKKELLKEINKEWSIKQNNLYNIINIFNKNTPTF